MTKISKYKNKDIHRENQEDEIWTIDNNIINNNYFRYTNKNIKLLYL